MKNWIVVGIDGTSSREWMAKDGSNSHVFQFVRDAKAPGHLKRYYHGPESMLGSDTYRIVQDLSYWIFKTLLKMGYISYQPALDRGYWVTLPRRVITKDQPLVCLIGHSRGGLAAIHLAQGILSKHRVPVRFMGLYDAVDRTIGMDGPVIRNVRLTYHAMRDHRSGSRTYFSNTGLEATNGCILVTKPFKTSHGGIGGDVVTSPEKLSSDRSCSLEMGQNIVDQCRMESSEADQWIRSGARLSGVSFR